MDGDFVGNIILVYGFEADRIDLSKLVNRLVSWFEV